MDQEQSQIVAHTTLRLLQQTELKPLIDALPMPDVEGPSGGILSWPLKRTKRVLTDPLARTDAGHDLRERLAAMGVPLSWERLETVLCDFHSMVKGRYYVGHDIDQMLEQAEKAPPAIRDLILAARAATLPERYLGEVQGWSGVSDQLVYAPGKVPSR